MSPSLLEAAIVLPPSFPQWVQLGQAFVALANLCFVAWFFWLTRRDKRRELELAVDQFWLQKVIVEPHAKSLDELYATLLELLLKAQSEAKKLREERGGSRDEAIASHADTASRHIERFRFQILPLLNVVVDPLQTHAEPPSAQVDKVIDTMDDALTTTLAQIFDRADFNVDQAQETLRGARFDLLRVLFLLHRYPFQKENAWRRKRGT
jgi:hypothetical protein